MTSFFFSFTNSMLPKKQAAMSDTQESDSSESSSNILRRNYEILRRKTNEKLNRSANSSHRDDDKPKHLVILSNENTEDKSSAGIEEALEVSFNSTNSLHKTTPETSLTIAKPAKIKVVKKPKTPVDEANDLRVRSISPGLLRRGPDVIETIETTTSMSFIMNKNVNLIVEEKRTDPPVRLSSAISQPQLYQTKIDDLLSMADSLIRNSNKSTDREATKQANYYEPTYYHHSRGQKQQEQQDSPIPITIQSRSKSEPKLIDPVYAPTQNNYDYYDAFNTPTSHRHTDDEAAKSRITFHKYDSNEIIAVVNMPRAYETTTVESVNKRESINAIINSNLRTPASEALATAIKSNQIYNNRISENNRSDEQVEASSLLHKSPQFCYRNAFSKSVPNLNENEQCTTTNARCSIQNAANFINSSAQAWVIPNRLIQMLQDAFALTMLI